MPFTTLINAQDLADRLQDPNWVVLDCRFSLADKTEGERQYRAGHIPGARYANLDQDMSSPQTPASGRHPLPNPKELIDRLNRWGVDRNSQVVVYDAGGGSTAARMWWLLRWLGQEAAALLDGGFKAWRAAGRPVTDEAPAVREPVAGALGLEPHNELHIDAELVAQKLDRGDIVLIDARGAVRFRGDKEPLDPVAGHIPGSINLPFEDNLDQNGRFLPAAELFRRFAERAEGPAGKEVIHTCGSGVTACHNLLAMEHAGLTGSRLYVGSWSDWITDPRRPVASGPE